MQTSFLKQLKEVEHKLDQVRDSFLEKIAFVAVSKSPVDTGAYVTSMTITTGSGNGRSRSSAGKPRRQDRQEKQDEAYSQLMGDINSIGPDVTRVFLANRSPHAKIVEDKQGYAVFAIVKNLSRELMQEAITEVGLR